MLREIVASVLQGRYSQNEVLRVPHPNVALFATLGWDFDFRGGPALTHLPVSNGTNLFVQDFYAAFPITTCVQCEHRFASIGISLKHSGHFLVVGAAAAGSSLCMRAINQFTGTTTKK